MKHKEKVTLAKKIKRHSTSKEDQHLGKFDTPVWKERRNANLAKQGRSKKK